MRDPHVVSLRYRLETDERTRYNDPAPLEYEAGEFHLRLQEAVLTCEMKEHHSTERDARAAVEPFLRSWELDAALTRGDIVRFVFEEADTVDRNPPPPGTSQVVLLRMLGLSVAAEVTRAIREQLTYPQPPRSFVASPNVETMWHRYTGYLEGREPLAAMAYFCLSLVQWRARGRSKAVLEYDIERDVLDTLGTLVSERGDRITARKFDSHSTLQPLTEAEVRWIKSAVKTLIRQIGTYDSGATPCRLRMSDLPAL